MVSNRTLAKVAGFGGVIVIGSALYMKYKIQSNIKRSEFFQTAVKQFTGTQVVKDLLGEPILVGNVDLGDTTNNYCDGTQAKFSITVRGPKMKGTLTFETVRDETSGTWSVKLLEFLTEDKSRKLVLR